MNQIKGTLYKALVVFVLIAVCTTIGNSQVTDYSDSHSLQVDKTLRKSYDRQFDESQLNEFKNQSRFDYNKSQTKSSPGIFTRILFSIARFFGQIVNLLGVLAYALFIGVLGLIIYMFIKSSHLGFEGPNPELENEILRFDDIEENIHQIDFELRIKEAVAKGDFAKAIQLFYLRCIKILSDQSLITLDDSKTNHDYLNEIKSLKLKDKFKHLTYIFEYIRYGEFHIDQIHFEAIRVDFEAFPQLIKTKK